jgi:NAD(P)-dependent dehydrogenase (short-subunit alcohol dehydrogenase family)
LVVVNDLGVALDGSESDETPADALVAEITATGGSAVSDSTDITDHAAATAMIEGAVERFGRLDVLVNVAGILRDRMIYNMSEPEWDDVIRVHMKGYFNTIKPAAVYWRSQRNEDAHNRIINFTSGSGLWGGAGQPNYAAAKSGVVGLTLSCSNALIRYGVTSNAIAPLASTRMTESIPTSQMEVAAGAMGAEHIAPIVAYLASEDSQWCNGRVFEAKGDTVSLYDFVRTVDTIESNGPWDLEQLQREIEGKLRPAAEATPNPFFSL